VSSVDDEYPGVFVVPERLTAETREAFRRAVFMWFDGAIARRMSRVVLDVSAMEDIDINGVSLLLVLQRRAAAHEIIIALRRPTGPVREMMILAGLMAFFEIET
jgi:anti-anti-sigma regulatory factor